jgi:hypothetical protein
VIGIDVDHAVEAGWERRVQRHHRRERIDPTAGQS